MSRVEETAILAVLAALTLAGTLLWMRQGTALWLDASFVLCF